MVNSFEHKVEILKNVTFVHEEQSQYQKIEVYDSPLLGRILILDGAIQFASSRFEDDNYSKDMTRLVLNKDRDYDHVIIIGGGDLIIAAHILNQYPKVKKITVCEIDERVIEVTKQYFSFAKVIKEAKEKGTLDIIIEDGASYMDKLI